MATVSGGFVIDLVQLFQRQFGSKPYVINKEGELSEEASESYQINEGFSTQYAAQEFTKGGHLLKEEYQGIEVLLPVKFFDQGNEVLSLPFVVVSIRGRKHVIETPMWERQGEVLEQYCIGGYNMTVKGFLIAKDKKFPEAEYIALRKAYEDYSSLQVDNGLFNLFLKTEGLQPFEQRRVVLMDLDFPEVTGGKHAKPFVLTLKQDSIFTLELDS